MKKYKAKVFVTLRENILDVQGKAIEHALHSLEFNNFNNVRIGKYVELEVEAQNDGQAEEMVKSACEKLIANPIIENYNVEIIE
jgi:phosphoribosylformylglycinamidine synthase